MWMVSYYFLFHPLSESIRPLVSSFSSSLSHINKHTHTHTLSPPPPLSLFLSFFFFFLSLSRTQSPAPSSPLSLPSNPSIFLLFLSVSQYAFFSIPLFSL